jgi:hypothetical protein
MEELKIEEVKNLENNENNLEKRTCCEVKKECCADKKMTDHAGCHGYMGCYGHMNHFGHCGHKIVKIILAIIIAIALLSIGACFGAKHARNEGNFQNGYSKHMRGNRGAFIQNGSQINSQAGRPMMRATQGNVGYQVQGAANGQVFEITTQPAGNAAVNSQPVQITPASTAIPVKPLK